MAQTKKKWVRFKSGCKIPAGILDKEKITTVAKDKEVQLPEDYAKHMKSTGLADFCDAPKKPAAEKSATNTSAAKASAKADPATSDDLSKTEKTVSDGGAASEAAQGSGS